MCKVSSAYFVLIGYIPYNKLAGRFSLNVFVPMGVFTLEFVHCGRPQARVHSSSSVQFM